MGDYELFKHVVKFKPLLGYTKQYTYTTTKWHNTQSEIVDSRENTLFRPIVLECEVYNDNKEFTYYTKRLVKKNNKFVFNFDAAKANPMNETEHKISLEKGEKIILMIDRDIAVNKMVEGAQDTSYILIKKKNLKSNHDKDIQMQWLYEDDSSVALETNNK